MPVTPETQKCKKIYNEINTKKYSGIRFRFEYLTIMISANVSSKISL